MVIGEWFDLAFAATAWHWIDPTMRYQRAWELLRADGHLALWSATHVFPTVVTRFFLDIQDIYDAATGAVLHVARRADPSPAT